jgi:hypothetical protein
MFILDTKFASSSRADFRPENDPILPMLLLAFMPPGLKDIGLDDDRESGGNYFETNMWSNVVSRFHDKGDDSIDDINDLLGSRWF